MPGSSPGMTTERGLELTPSRRLQTKPLLDRFG